MKINVLPQSIANMIAAGEVVERPASVVKELAENSVDAGAKSITVEIKKGGMSYIRITDDGCGIASNEVLTAFMRHATSKIRTEEDLNAIYTLGFRGEALASIAAVSRMDIFTKPKDQSFGYSASLEGGEVTEQGEAGCPDGTTITVRDLFFNTPARMKFLKSDATETSYVTDSIHKLILSHPEVAVKLIVNGKTTVSSPGDGKVLSAIRAVFGRDYISHMNELSYNEDGIKVTGYVGTNALARKDRRQQVFFINGRYVKSKIISAALSEAYQNTMMVGKYPVAVISINVSGAFVDVNVHPTKIEVRFSDDKKVYNSVFWAVKEALSAKKYVPEIDISKTKEQQELLKVRKQIASGQTEAKQVDINFLKDTYAQSLGSLTKSEKTPDKNPPSSKQHEASGKSQNESASVADLLKSRIEEQSFFTKEDVSSFRAPSPDVSSYSAPAPGKEEEKIAEVSLQTEVFVPDTKAEPALDETLKEEPLKKETLKSEPIKKSQLKCGIDFAIVGQIFNTYIIVQKDNEMIIIDQHAAHERIYFEELVAEFKEKGVKSQMLLMPVTVDFDPVTFDIAVKNFDTLSSLGFECEEFGASSIIVRAVPSVMSDTEIRDTIIDVVSLLAKGTADIKKTLMEDVLHTMACKKALKGNTNITLDEMKSLAEKVLSFDSINTCPHGRPIITSMTKYELEKNFKRIV
ncbi:MAG: DNA mismatch repair endonuclease MutL [Clostridia bacterium]|nr:DNA mismatch repair endonuclease MutL [Clostridia bacterium]